MIKWVLKLNLKYLYVMKKTIFTLLLGVLTLSFSSCDKRDALTSRIESDIKGYKNDHFHDWLFGIGSDGYSLKSGEISYTIYRTYDDTDQSVGLMIGINDGVAEYNKDKVLDSLVTSLEDKLKNNGLVLSVNKDFGCVLINLRNDEHKTNHDDYKDWLCIEKIVIKIDDNPVFCNYFGQIVQYNAAIKKHMIQYNSP